MQAASGDYRTHVLEVGDGDKIAIDEIGSGHPIVLIHGIPGGPSVWRSVADELASEFQVVVPHLLGFAASSRPRTAERLWADRQAAAISVAIDQMEIASATLVGHDFGGPIAAMLLEPCWSRWTHLAIFSSNIFPDTPIPFPLSLTVRPLIGRLARAVLFSRPSLAMMLKQGVGPSGPKLSAADYLGDRDQSRSIGSILGHALCHLNDLYAPIERSMSGNQLPALVGWGDRDPFFSVEQGRRTAQCVGGEFVLLEGAGHFLPEERPAVVAGHIRRLVSGNDACTK